MNKPTQSRDIGTRSSFGALQNEPNQESPLIDILKASQKSWTAFEQEGAGLFTQNRPTSNRGIRYHTARPYVHETRNELSREQNPVLDLAQRIASEVSRLGDDTGAAIIYAAAHSSLLAELRLIAEKASRQNWDGNGALPVLPDTYQNAIRFVMALPPTLPDPELGADLDGSVSFEWYRGPRQVFSISIDGDATLHYAGLFGVNKTHGAEHFTDKIPDPVALGLARILREEPVWGTTRNSSLRTSDEVPT